MVQNVGIPYIEYLVQLLKKEIAGIKKVQRAHMMKS